MQFHWIAPLFLLAVSWYNSSSHSFRLHSPRFAFRKWIFGALVASVFILIDIICTAVIVSKNNYDYGLISDFYHNYSNSTHNYMEDVYSKPWCRLAPYAVGLLVGQVLFTLYQRSTTDSWDALLHSRQAHQQPSWKLLFGWLVSLSILSLCVFGTFGDYSGRAFTRSGRITFLTLSRLGWAIGLSLIIITCFRGYGGEFAPHLSWMQAERERERSVLGLANRFLSHRLFEKLAKLTYGAFLWHELVLFVNYLGRDQPLHYTLANLVCQRSRFDAKKKRTFSPFL